MKKLYLIGGGSHCDSVVDVITFQGVYEIAGIIDSKVSIAENLSAFKHIFSETIPETLINPSNYFLVTIGNIKNPFPRKRIIDLLAALNAQLATVISPRAYVSTSAKIEAGTVVHHGAVVNAHARIGAHNIVNSLALVEHGAETGMNVHVSTGALINGGCKVGDHSMIGSGAVLKQGVVIAGGIMVGASSLVTKSLSEPGVYTGVPVKLQAEETA